MKYLVYILLTFSNATNAQEAPENLLLNGSSIVALYTPEWEITENEKAAEGFYDFLDDYQYYAGEIKGHLSNNVGAEFVASFAHRVSFSEIGVHSVYREELSGYGFIVYVPGKAPKIFPGVATDVDVLCVLKELDSSIKVGVSCKPNQ
ncbi:hypothetical protein [Shewanella litorisediminis]|uniref:Uncharacterized protein n=1 Tax=Shewanella litorisediminis TaxID=1173586 RepID=A0ABX7G7W9_9GAMM|nr:hypothetical protein [Shewanella litorisediminis]MCL2919087.1 hypothetical protein [Shewanella litorisediminis]QRH03343.1 hypothetical protein JQC75_08160 [Shewanella litorisediminis]